MLKEIKTLDVLLMTWKNNGGNQCKLVVISKIWPSFLVIRNFNYVANWSTQSCIDLNSNDDGTSKLV